MKTSFLKATELARLTNVSRAAISAGTKKGLLHRDAVTGLYDPQHPTNSAYIANAKAADQAVKSDTPPAQIPADLEELYRRKLQAEVRRTEGQAEKIQLEMAVKRKDLVPAQMIGIFHGYFGAAVRNNLLPIGNRVARGDTKLRARIDKEITRGLTAALGYAAAQLRKEAPALIREFEKRENSND